MARVISAALAGFVVLIAITQTSRAGTSSKENKEKATTGSSESRTKATPAVKLTKSEDRLVKAVNAYRAKKGLEPLTVDPKLMKVARDAAPHFSHCIKGTWCWDRAHKAGFTGWASDDLANGYESPEDAVDGWATSDGHAHQMRGYFKMNGEWRNYKFNRIGVGISGRKYAAVFGHYEEKRGEEPKRATN
jgi:uncharacterized protein YkwD